MVDTKELHAAVYGRGEATVLMLHGAPGASSDFAPVVEALSSSHRILAPDLPGYGRSIPAPRAAPLAVSQARIEAMLLAKGVSEVAIVGHSLGAYRALDLALRRNVRVTAIVTLGGFAGLADAHRAAMRATVAQLRGLNDFSSLALRRSLVVSMVAPGFAERAPHAFACLENWFDSVSPADLADELGAACDSADLHPRLAELSIPLLALVGDLDQVVPTHYSRAIVTELPGASLQVIPGCGHALLIEAPELTTDAIKTALAPKSQQATR